MVVNDSSNKRKQIFAVIMAVLMLASLPFSTAYAALGHTYTENRHVFLIGGTIGYAPFAAVVRCYIAVDYSRNTAASTTSAATCLEIACTYWAGEGIADLVPFAGIQAKYYKDGTTTLLRSQQLYKDVSFYKVSNASWYAIAVSGTRAKTSMGNHRIRAEGGGNVSVQGALNPGYGYTVKYSF